MLITPSHADRGSVGHRATWCWCAMARPKMGRSPSRAARLHAAIYRRHPKFRADRQRAAGERDRLQRDERAARQPDDSRELFFLKDVARVPFGEQYQDGRLVAERLSPENPVALIDNDGVLVCGTSVLDAFDRLEVLETTAEALINSRPLGEVIPLSDTVIAAIHKG